jgi:acetolactate synthase-1/2/3 large subunit
MMQIQELSTAKRHGVRFIACTYNDGGYASEAHKFRSLKMDPSEALHGRSDFAAIARAFGLRGTTVKKPGQFESLLRDYEKADCAEVWDVHINDKVMSRLFRRVWFGEA